MIKKGYTHITLSLFGPFIFSVLTIMFIFLLQFLMKYLDRLVGKGLSLGIIIELIALNLAWMLVLAVPMGVLIATLMVYGKMSGDHEITAFKAAGINPIKLMMPAILGGVLVAGVMFWFNDYILPDANFRSKTLFRDIRNKKPTFELQPGIFSDLISGFSIMAKKTDPISGQLHDVTIFDYSDPSRQQVITANTGNFAYSTDFRYLIMTLNEGESHDIDYLTYRQYRKVTFQSQKVLFDATGFGFERSSEGAHTRGNREMSIKTMETVADSLAKIQERSTARIMDRFDQSLRNIIQENKNIQESEFGHPFLLPEDRRINERLQVNDSTLGVDSLSIVLLGLPLQMQKNILYTALNTQIRFRNFIESEVISQKNLDRDIGNFLVEIHKKYALPLACFVFVLVGVPLGIQSKRGGVGVGAGLSLAFFLIYWIFLLGGEKLADRQIVSPQVGMWSANVVVFSMGCYLIFWMLKDAQPTTWLGRKVKTIFRRKEITE